MFALVMPSGAQFLMTSADVGRLLANDSTYTVKRKYEQSLIVFDDGAYVACPRGSDWRDLIYQASGIQVHA